MTHLLKRVLNYVGYYQCFIPNFSAVAILINEFMKRGRSVYELEGHCSESFEQLYRTLCSSSILVCPTSNLPYFLCTDLGEESLCTMLAQPYVTDCALSYLTDSGKGFINFKLLQILNLLDIKPIKTSIYIANNNGQLERFLLFRVSRLEKVV